VKKANAGGMAEAVIGMVEFAVMFGFGSGAAFAVAVGQFLLAGVLGLVAIGVFLRFKRGRLHRRSTTPAP
jgi:hypothetical protein